MTSTAAAVVFWLGLLAAIYTYAGFPLLMQWLVSVRQRRDGHRAAAAARMTITVVIPAHNEEGSIEAKLRNVLEGDYPRELLDVIVVSDASTDRTNELVGPFSAQGVRLLVQAARQGKTAGLNRALAEARGELVVFTDANALFPREAIGRLAAYFSDERIGVVTGYTRYTTSGSGEITDATNAYTALERSIKRAESCWGYCIGADGAIFAMRRSLYRPLRDDDINDLVLPLAVIDQGYGSLLAEDVFCSEGSGKSLDSEFRRQSRIANRSLRALWRHAHLFNPRRSLSLSFFLFSHKVMRFAVPVLLLGSAFSLAVLASGGGFYLIMGVAAVSLSALVLATGNRPEGETARRPWSRHGRSLRIFLTINLAILHGWWKFLSGNEEATWQHDRALIR